MLTYAPVEVEVEVEDQERAVNEHLALSEDESIGSERQRTLGP